MTILALAFALGIAIGKHQPEPVVWYWLILAALFVLAAALPRLRDIVPPVLIVAVAMAALGAAWYTVKTEWAAPNDLAVMLGEESRIVKVRGVAEAGPTVHRATRGSLAQFGYREPSTYFPARIDELVLPDGTSLPVRGRVLVSVGEALPPFRAGDRIEATGHFHPFEKPRNPGEMDRHELAKGLGQAGSLNLPRRDLLTVTPSERFSLYERFLGWRENLQRRAGAHLLSDLPDLGSSDRDVLLKALLLGQREPDLHNLNDAFARLGISHFLAISGLHVGIFVGFIVIALRFWRGQRPWHAWLIIAIVIGYLVLVEVRVPVLRAGVMTIAACLGFAFGRRLKVAGLVSLSGILLLLWRPDQLFQPGFQLSFAVVLGLLHLSPLLRERWFGLSNQEASTLAEVSWDWVKDASAIASTAWIVATPIVAFHFGMISPLGIILAVIGVPVVALLLALGYAKILLTLILPSAAMLVGLALSLTADFAIAVILTLDTIPFSFVQVPFPQGWAGVGWALASLGLIWVWIAHPQWMPRSRGIICTCVLALWLMWPGIWPPSYALRVDMISVGHGACFVVRTGGWAGETLVFDAGSNTHIDAGHRWILPALRRLNVRAIDTIVISHPHFDHYAAVLELVDEYKPRRVYVTHQFIEHGRENPDTAVAHVADALTNRYRNAPRPIYAGETRTVGGATLTWLHPPKNLAEFGRDNEHSMVIRIDVAGRVVLLTGDVERAGTAGVLASNPSLRADVLEMPHHGAWHDLSADLLRRTRPALVLQSSSRTQWQRDRWQELLDEIGAERLVTHRDGAAWVEIARDGTITHGTFPN